MPPFNPDCSTDHRVQQWLRECREVLSSARGRQPTEAVRAELVAQLAEVLLPGSATRAGDRAHTSARLALVLVEGALQGGVSESALEAHVFRMLGVSRSVAIGTPVERLPTPCLVLDRERLDGNIRRMRSRAASLGVQLRPHIKTSKSASVATCAVGPGGPLTVSTLREAEYFASYGFVDLTYAVAIVPDRLDRAARLTAAGVQIGLFVERLDVARAMAAHPGRFDAFIEVDCGEDRTGTGSTEDLLAIARTLHEAPRCQLRGIATHGGHSYGARSVAERVAVAEQERATAVAAAEALRGIGIPCPEVSVGSTPTAVHAAHLQGVTEMRPGVYILGDLFQAGIGSHSVDDIACSVLSTVLSQRSRSGRVVIDAGGLALSKDRSTAGWPFDAGYGRLADAVSGDLLGGLQVASVHQEHGEVALRGDIPADRLAVGTRVRVLPNHICMTAAQYDRYHVVSEGRVVAIWPRVNGW